MKTISTCSSFRTLVMMFVIAISTLNLVGQTKHMVAVTDFKFTPAALTITAGDIVVWTNTGNVGHNVNGTQVTFPANPESFGNDVGLAWTYEYVFNTAGAYNYHCDPHSAGMKGSVTVNPAMEDSLKLTVNITDMDSHVGETFWLAVIDTTTKMEIGRVKQTVTANFSIVVPGIEVGKSYWVDFFADHNKNGVYNAPPGDSSWRLQLYDVKGDTVLDFVHTALTLIDIKWKTKLTVHFTAMTPHVGQALTLYVRDLTTGMGIDTVAVPSVTGPIFDMSSLAIEPTKSYAIDFYADYNKNGVYDVPPVDHAWRIMLENVVRDTIINFVHNTNFTNISFPTATEGLDGKVAGFRLYPNPASQYIDLLMPESYKEISSLKVYSVAGTLVDQKVVSGNVESFRYDLSGFKNGVYFMEINSGTQKNVLKFLKK